MKIVVVTKNMLPGGTERVVWNLISAWVLQAENEISLVLMDDSRDIFYKVPEACEVEIVHSQEKNGARQKLDRYRKLRKFIMDRKPDVVLSMPEEIGIYAALALVGTGIPVVVSERNNPWVMPYKKITRFLRKMIYPHTAGLIFQTKQAASFFSPKLQKKGIVLPNPVDVEALPMPYDGQREKIIIGTGRLEKQKNFPLLIEAFGMFYQRHPDYKLVIYGEGSLRGELEQQIAQLKLPAGTITLPGRTDRLAEELRTKAMFVLSSDFEGMPNVVIEAMAMGVPVISTDCPSGGSAELIEHGKTGLLTPVGDVKALTEAMCSLVEKPDLSQTIGKNGTYVRQALDSQVICKKWMEYLKHASKSNGRTTE